MRLSVAPHLMSTPVSFALWLLGMPSKQAAAGGSSADNAWKTL